MSNCYCLSTKYGEKQGQPRLGRTYNFIQKIVATKLVFINQYKSQKVNLNKIKNSGPNLQKVLVEMKI